KEKNEDETYSRFEDETYTSIGAELGVLTFPEIVNSSIYDCEFAYRSSGFIYENWKHDNYDYPSHSLTYTKMLEIWNIKSPITKRSGSKSPSRKDQSQNPNPKGQV
ncbi:42586_t:CDS:2, partial [Gigaspora margarita]